MIPHPYKNLMDFQYWSGSIEKHHFMDLKDIWNYLIDFKNNDYKIATAGSCFAQHVTKHIKKNKMNFLDLEPKPDNIPIDTCEKHGYNIYSCRYGNIYTVRQLLQLLKESLGLIEIKDIIWEKKETYYDSMRPNVTPNGLNSKNEVINSRKLHLKKVKEMFETTEVFIFTLGLTESWFNLKENIVYPSAPGVIAGNFDSEVYQFHNFNYNEILNDLEEFYKLLIDINPEIQIILTISPVPLKATYTRQHVLIANTYSKSVLRTVAFDFCMNHRGVYYFPSYELINSHCNRGMFYEKDMRSINLFGVNYVMKHFFNENNINTQINDDVICDDDVIM